jgi:hypothetical protein
MFHLTNPNLTNQNVSISHYPLLKNKLCLLAIDKQAKK